MRAQVPFSELMTIEQRKAAINKTLEAHLPFMIKKMTISLPGNTETDYTGGSSQMLLARGITIDFLRL